MHARRKLKLIIVSLGRLNCHNSTQ